MSQLARLPWPWQPIARPRPSRRPRQPTGPPTPLPLSPPPGPLQRLRLWLACLPLRLPGLPGLPGPRPRLSPWPRPWPRPCPLRGPGSGQPLSLPGPPCPVRPCPRPRWPRMARPLSCLSCRPRPGRPGLPQLKTCPLQPGLIGCWPPGLASPCLSSGPGTLQAEPSPLTPYPLPLTLRC